MQVLGGYGYLQEYRIEQTYRDLRIAAIYEGASGIHAMGVAARLLRLENGAAMNAFVDYLKGIDGGPALESARDGGDPHGQQARPTAQGLGRAFVQFD